MYGKLFTSMYDGTLASVGPWEALVTFQQMVVLADKEGIVDMTADAISRRTTIPLDIIEKGIHILMQPDPGSRSTEEEGRRLVNISDTREWGWRIVNYEHYRNMRSSDERRDYMRQYQRGYRERVNNVNNCKQNKPKQYAVSSKQKAEVEAEEKKKEKSERTHIKNLDKKALLAERPQEIPLALWDTFQLIRKDKKATLTVYALNGIIRECKKAGITLLQGITLCCENNWQGINAEWEKVKELGGYYV